MVVCPNCGHRSGEGFFCARCNALLPTTADLPSNVTLPDGRTVPFSGFPADPWPPHETTLGEDVVRVYGFDQGWWRDLADLVEQRAALALDILAPLVILRLADGAVVVAHALPASTRPLLTPPPDSELARIDDTLTLCRLLERALTPLHDAGLVWLNFDPAGLLSDGDRIQIQPLDCMVFPSGQCPGSVRVSTAYSPPELCAFRAGRIGRATDVFHVAIYAYYRLAGLSVHGFPGAGLEAFGFELPPLRVYAPTLPPGIAPVIMRGVAREPLDRFATLAEFVSALEVAVTQAHVRLTSDCLIRIESAGATAIGRAHVGMGLPNQDALAIVPRDDGLVAIVADGVTVTRIGSGDRASLLAVEVLARRLNGESTEVEIQAVCQEATAVILDAALAEVPANVSCDPCDLMSTTVVLAVVRGGEMLVGCAGDSRAYLITGGIAEQLTVDGDVRCIHLAAGWPPEQMRDLGADAFALYSCLGIGEMGPAGKLVPCSDRCTPRVRRWKLMPGDVVVLCSDGLVEEGVYLEPGELALYAARYGDPVDLANALVAAAVSRHRDPSAWEPEGRGDDVTCVVLKIGAVT